MKLEVTTDTGQDAPANCVASRWRLAVLRVVNGQSVEELSQHTSRVSCAHTIACACIVARRVPVATWDHTDTGLLDRLVCVWRVCESESM